MQVDIEAINLRLYCWQHKANHTLPLADVERIVYALMADALMVSMANSLPDTADLPQSVIPCQLEILKNWANDIEVFAEHVEQGVGCRIAAGNRTPERHRDGPAERLANLPDPCANTFDPTADRDS